MKQTNSYISTGIKQQILLRYYNSFFANNGFGVVQNSFNQQECLAI